MEDIPSIIRLQNEVNNSFKTKYKLESYLGKGNNSYIYRGISPNKNIYLIKFIPKKNDHRNILIEIGFMKALSLFPTSHKYINTCHDFNVSNAYIIVVMNVFRGQDINQFSNIIKLMPELEYLDMVKQILRHSLKALSYIHKRGIAHQNISPQNIVVSCPNGKNIEYLKLVNFGQSCGYYFNIDNHKFLNKKCKYIVNRMNKFPPEYYQKEKLITEIKALMKTNADDTVELYMAKKDDIWILGTLLWCLINRSQVGNNPLSIPFPENKDMLEIFSNENDYHTFRGMSSLKNIHNFIVNNILVPVQNRKNANDLLSKFMLLEKYGWEYVN
jgi:serine/threonine protein kinase